MDVALASRLVPPDAIVPSPAMTRVLAPLTQGLPQNITLDRDVTLAVTMPNGLATAWRDADPAAIVSRGTEQLLPRTADPTAPLADAAVAPVRLLVLIGGVAVAALPLAAALRAEAPEDDLPGVRVALAIIRWEIRAGTLRGPGEFGSSIELLWRRADRGADRFFPPPVHAQLRERLSRPARLESDPEAAPPDPSPFAIPVQVR
jgi:hypothetical protein